MARVEWKKIVLAGQNANADWADNLARSLDVGQDTPEDQGQALAHATRQARARAFMRGEPLPQATSPETLGYAKFTGALAYALSRTEVTYLKYVRTADGGRLGVRLSGGQFIWLRVADVATRPDVHQRLRDSYKALGR